jgi:DNA-binding beta-propeller fold protein YncE
MKHLVPLLLAACSASAPAQETKPGLSGYRADPAWPKKPAEFKWGDVPGVTVDKDDNVWMFTRAAPTVQVYSPAGDLVRAWRDVDGMRAHHIRIDPEGHVWLCNIGFHTVTKYTVDGKPLLQLGTRGMIGADEKTFNKPTDVAVTPAGDIFVSDGYGNSRVVHFDKNGKFVKSWGRKGTGPGEFDIVHGIGLDSKGLLYVADRSNARIQVFKQSGEFVAQWRNLLVPWSIWITKDDEIWTCGSSPTLHANDQGQTGIPPQDQVFMRLDTSGRLLQLWCPPLGTIGQDGKPGETSWCHAIAPDSKGNLYVGDIMGHRLQKFVPVR